MGSIGTIGILILNGLENILSFKQLSKDDMASIQPRRFDCSDKELTTVGVGAYRELDERIKKSLA